MTDFPGGIRVFVRNNVRILAIVIFAVFATGSATWFIWDSNRPDRIAHSFVKAISEDDLSKTNNLLAAGFSFPVIGGGPWFEAREEIGNLASIRDSRALPPGFVLSPKVREETLTQLANYGLDYRLEDIRVVVVEYSTIEGSEQKAFVFLHKEKFGWKVYSFFAVPLDQPFGE